MRSGHIYRAAVRRHVLAAFPLRFAHFRGGRTEASHRRIAEQNAQEQNAYDLASESHATAYCTGSAGHSGSDAGHIANAQHYFASKWRTRPMSL